METESVERDSDSSPEEREDSYYYPGGVPITPQARRFGYEFPVYVSGVVWDTYVHPGKLALEYDKGQERRIWELLQFCYEGMAKKLATSDDFLWYPFKIWYWDNQRPKAQKKRRGQLAARLFLYPHTEMPWLYIFDPRRDDGSELSKEKPDE